MQSSCRLDDVESRTQVEVVGVAQDNLGFHLLAQLLEVDALHASHGAYWHEDRCLNLSVVGGDDASTCIAGLICYL